MGLSLKPGNLKRYKDIAALVVRYRRSDMARAAAGGLMLLVDTLFTDEPSRRSRNGRR